MRKQKVVSPNSDAIKPTIDRMVRIGVDYFRNITKAIIPGKLPSLIRNLAQVYQDPYRERISVSSLFETMYLNASHRGQENISKLFMPKKKSEELVELELRLFSEINAHLEQNFRKMSSQKSVFDRVLEMKSKIKNELELIKDLVEDVGSQSFGYRNRLREACKYPLEHQILTVNTLIVFLGELESEYDQWVRFIHNHHLKPISLKSKKIAIHSKGLHEDVFEIFNRFHKVVRALRRRRTGRPKLEIRNEYDVQDLIYYLLVSRRDDVIYEEPTGKLASMSAFIDFVLKDIDMAIEIKMPSNKLSQKALVKQILVDMPVYKTHRNSETIVFFIYDPFEILENPVLLIKDLEKQSSPGHEIKVFVSR